MDLCFQLQRLVLHYDHIIAYLNLKYDQHIVVLLGSVVCTRNATSYDHRMSASKNLLSRTKVIDHARLRTEVLRQAAFARML